MSKVYILLDMNYGLIQNEAFLNKSKAKEKSLELENDERYKWTVRELKLNEEGNEVKPLKVEPNGKVEGTELKSERGKDRKKKQKYRF